MYTKNSNLFDTTLFPYTAEPPNKGHVETRSFVLYREVSFIRRLKCTGIIGIGMSRFVLYREVSFIGGSNVYYFTVMANVKYSVVEERDNEVHHITSHTD